VRFRRPCVPMNAAGSTGRCIAPVACQNPRLFPRALQPSVAVDATQMTVTDPATGEILWSDYVRSGYMLESRAAKALIDNFRLELQAQEGDLGPCCAATKVASSNLSRPQASKLRGLSPPLWPSVRSPGTHRA
jgi:hypothetical protein